MSASGHAGQIRFDADALTQPMDAVGGSLAASHQSRSMTALLLELSKARLTALVLLTTVVGFVLASPPAFDWVKLAIALTGTALAACGAAALNQCIEAQRDARMLRTRGRPLPSGELDAATAWTFGVACGVGGPILLLIGTNAITAALGLGCVALYVLAYTPLKTRSPLNTLVGAVCGAIPPMMGWSAASGGLEIGAWVLGLILFIWQIPHFLALAWMYREDYQRGGFRMLPLIDPNGNLTCQMIVLYSLALVPAGLMLTFAGVTGGAFAIGAVLLALGMTWFGLQFHRARSVPAARRLFLASVIYLPLLLGLMVADRSDAGRTHVQRPATLLQISSAWKPGR